MKQFSYSITNLAVPILRQINLIMIPGSVKFYTHHAFICYTVSNLGMGLLEFHSSEFTDLCDTF